MPWVRLDDRFASNRKIELLSDRAFRLHVSALCWCAANLTDGKILDEELRFVAHVRGMTATARELERRGLWERLDDGWKIHDYLDYQPSRDQVVADRESNAERQRRYRERHSDKPKPPGRSPNGKRNGVTPGVSNGATNDAPAATRPDVTPTGVTSAAARARDPLALDTLADLKAAIGEAGLTGFSWKLQASQIERTRQVVDRVGIDPMVALAVSNAQLKGTPANASAWIADWESIEPSRPRQPTGETLPVAAGAENVLHFLPGQRPATSDVRAQQALEVGRRLQAQANAHHQQEQP